MSSKIISFILAVVFLFYSGCSDTVHLTQGQVAAKDISGDVVIVTTDGLVYTLPYPAYTVKSDTIRGSGMVYHDGTTQPFTGIIPLSTINFIEFEKVNFGKSVLAVIGGIAGAAAAGILVIAIAIGISRPHTSCPYAYTYDGSSYHFESETFAGAVIRGAERTSYDNLRHLKPVNGTFRLRVTNEREETDFVNELRILAVDHPAGLSVIPDRRGMMHTIPALSNPISCRDYSGKDVLRTITSNDSVYWESDVAGKDFTTMREVRDGLVLEFQRPPESSSAKLVVNGVNTNLGAFAFRKLFQLKGENRLLWYQQLERDSSERAKLLGWMKREGMLHISVWNGSRWVEQEVLPDVGPSLAKDQVALLNLKNATGPTLKIRLESTTDLWKIDRVGIDYSADKPIKVTPLPLASAVTDSGVSVAALLDSVDQRYYTIYPGESAELMFSDVPAAVGNARSYILRSRGFYYLWSDPPGREDSMMLSRVLTEPGFGAMHFLPEWKSVRKNYGDLR